MAVAVGLPIETEKHEWRDFCMIPTFWLTLALGGHSLVIAKAKGQISKIGPG